MTSDRKNGALELEVVIKSFSEAQKTLTAMGAELTELSKINEQERENLAGLSDAAKEISVFAKNAGERVTELAVAQSQVEALLKAGSDLIDGSQLADVISKVGTLSQSIDAIQKTIIESKDQLVGEISASEERITSQVLKAISDSEERRTSQVLKAISDSEERRTSQILKAISDSEERRTAQLNELAETALAVESRVSRSIFGRIF